MSTRRLLGHDGREGGELAQEDAEGLRPVLVGEVHEEGEGARARDVLEEAQAEARAVVRALDYARVCRRARCPARGR